MENINHNELWLYENPDLVKRWLKDKGELIDKGSFAKYVEMDIKLTPCNGGYKATDINTDLDEWGRTQLEAIKHLEEAAAISLEKDSEYTKV